MKPHSPSIPSWPQISQRPHLRQSIIYFLRIFAQNLFASGFGLGCASTKNAISLKNLSMFSFLIFIYVFEVSIVAVFLKKQEESLKWLKE